MLSRDSDRTCVIFSTYQSLVHITEAQQKFGAPEFDLTLMHEAHRTTGVESSEIGFRAVHHDENLKTRKRLYMTATPRIYTQKSRKSLKERGIETVDMSDVSVYGPELHRLRFSTAVDADMLSDYRVIVLGIHEDAVTPAVRRDLVALGETDGGKNTIVTDRDITRVIGTPLAINGATDKQLHKTIGFANTIRRSKFFAEAMNHPNVRGATTRRMRRADAAAGAAMQIVTQHVDGKDSALIRNKALRELQNADKENTSRMLCNVRLFGEGVDVPSLDAIVFMEPRDSQVDVVQAVGRVMRKSEGKQFGYIVIPVPIPAATDFMSALEERSDAYKSIGRVLRALASHDERLAADPLRFVEVKDPQPEPESDPDDEEADIEEDGENWYGSEQTQLTFDLSSVSEGLYAHVVAASGLGKPGLRTSEDIEAAVKYAGRQFETGELGEDLAAVLGVAGEARSICTIAALLLANACLMHRRLGDLPNFETLSTLNRICSSPTPITELRDAWQTILQRDYAPVFEPALAVLDSLPNRPFVVDALRVIAECANNVADSLSELGYDHARPLYHRILLSAKSDGAFYTNNLSALMLARLALNEDFCDWSDPEAISKLRIIDPACGTGTLLMAALKVIKDRANDAQGLKDDQEIALHKLLVESVLCGLDINRHATQLAACNLSLGAPNVDYKQMNLHTVKHGPQDDGSVKSGSLEILSSTSDAKSLSVLRNPLRSMSGLETQHLDSSDEAEFPLKDLDLVIMNPPFTNNEQRSSRFSGDERKAIQQNELNLRNEFEWRDPEVGSVINSNAIESYFTPIADQLVSRQRNSTLAMVIPAAACAGASSLPKRKFLAKRFHIETIITSHDPKRPAFSENAGMHECLMIARRKSLGETSQSTEFVSLRKMPATPDEAIAVADVIASGETAGIGSIRSWPAELIEAGDWTPVQWFDGELTDTIRQIESSEHVEAIGMRYAVGPAGQGVLGTFRSVPSGTAGAIKGFHSISSKFRRTMFAEPDAWYAPKPGKDQLATRYLGKRSNLMVAMRINTVSGRLCALWTREPSFGWWVPIKVSDDERAKALAAWWNSTPVRLMLLNRRGKTLMYPFWQLAHLREIRIPKPDNPAWGALYNAYEQACEIELLPMKDAEQCEARRIIDAAAALALGVDESEVADWRRRLSKEPTITNRAAE